MANEAQLRDDIGLRTNPLLVHLLPLLVRAFKDRRYIGPCRLSNSASVRAMYLTSPPLASAAVYYDVSLRRPLLSFNVEMTDGVGIRVGDLLDIAREDHEHAILAQKLTETLVAGVLPEQRS